MSSSCLLNSHRSHLTVHPQAAQHRDSQMMAGHQGGLPLRLSRTPQSLQSAKEGESEHAAKYSVLILKCTQSGI